MVTKLELDNCEDSNDYTKCLPPELWGALSQCMECGKCVGTCPAARISDFNPRALVKKVLNKDETVLIEDTLWKCFLCHQCWMICPKEDMNLPDLIFRLREISIQKGYAPSQLKSLTKWLDQFYKTGKIAGPNKVAEGRVENIKEISKKSNLEVLRDYLKKLEEKKKKGNKEKMKIVD